LTPERWAQIEELFHRAAECEPERRFGLLDEACSDDPELRREVEALLVGEERAGNHLHAAVRGVLDDFGFPLRGETVSHYRILDGVDSGGMGQVYRAEDIKLGRRVALKFLPQDSAKDPGALGRFEREARAASALEHPNICPIYEFGEHEGQPFLVMQLLEGQTLRDAAGAEKAPLELNRLLELAVQILDGLDAAHHHGIIHRDIKPANILVTSQGQAKILDFGLAKLARTARLTEEDVEPDPQGDGGAKEKPRENASLATPDPFLSRTGVAMGTAGYMSPEQVRGEKLDARTDLFSFGSVLYEMATGKRAFTGDTGPVFQDAILKQVPSPVRKVNPQLPAELERIISKALEKDRETRYQSALEMRTDLQSLKRKMEPRQTLPGWALVSGSAAILLIAGAMFWIARRQQLQPQLPPGQKLRQLTTNSEENRVLSGAISLDGKYLAYSDLKGIHIKVIETGETHTFPQPEGLKNMDVDWEIVPKWFPDNTRFLANAHPGQDPGAWTSSGTSVWIFSRLGGSPSKLRDNAYAYSVSPDGSLISFGTNKGRMGDREIWLMGPTGEQARKIYEAGGEDSAIRGLIWSPDGQRAIYEKTEGLILGPNDNTLLSVDLKGGPPTIVLSPSEAKNMRDYAWLPDGRLIYSVDEPLSVGSTCNYRAMRIDAGTGRPLEKPQQLTNWTRFCAEYASATADGKRLAFLEWSLHGADYVADLEAGGTRLVNSRHFTMDESNAFIAGWTADSKTVIIALERGDHYEIQRQLLSADTPEPVVSGAGGIEDANLSPDDKWVIVQVRSVSAEPSTPVQLMRVPITGGSPELIFQIAEGTSNLCARQPAALCALAERSKDRKQMIITAFDPFKGRGAELARFDVDPSFDQTQDSWDISPDGTRLAARGVDGYLQIRSVGDGTTQVIRVKGLNDIGILTWAADGKGFLVSSGSGGGPVLYHVDLQGNPKALWKCSSNECYGRQSPDGRHLNIWDARQNSNMWIMENF
jgi:eukaryotic-like serine/threonine-protein kinase